MYLLDLYYENARENQTGGFQIPQRAGKIPKWTRLPSSVAAQELLQLMVLGVTGTRFIPHIPYPLETLLRESNSPLKLVVNLSCHPETEGKTRTNEIGYGIALAKEGTLKHLKPCQVIKKGARNTLPKISSSNDLNKNFLLAYGPCLSPHRDTDDFEFNNPFLRITHFHSLFTPQAKLTDPTGFLNCLQYRGVRYKRFLPLNMLKAICRLGTDALKIDTSLWMTPEVDFAGEWTQLEAWQQKILILVLDICRHLLDAFPHSENPLEMPGVILLHRPDLLCNSRPVRPTNSLQEDAFVVEICLDRLLPRMQFIISGPQGVPDTLRTKQLTLPPAVAAPLPLRPPRKIKPGTILLIDVDGKLPNLALMKLSAYYRDKGRQVILHSKGSGIKGPDRVYASSIFSSPSSARHIEKLKHFYGDSLILGGSGVDIQKRLPEKIEQMPADYTLYPELGDRAIGFITRGCPFNCPFCLVPQKEGKPRQVSDLDSLLQRGRNKLILLDDNILAHPRAPDFLEAFASRKVKVNFTQTLDIHLVDREKARLIRQINCSNTKFTRPNFHFSLNDHKRLGKIRENYDLLGFTCQDNVEFVSMYGFNTTLAQDLERFEFLRSLPGAYVFMQQYQPILKGPLPHLEDYFDENADDHIDRLTKVIFPQNMKSMEKYYGWLSRRYSMTFGKVHMGLIDTIFKYNRRHLKGNYIATLSGTRKLAAPLTARDRP